MHATISCQNPTVAEFRRPVVIAEGETAGWITAATLAKTMGYSDSIRLVEAVEIGIVGAGVSLFQKDNNYLIFTVVRRDDAHVLRLVLAESGVEPRTC